MKNKVLTAWIVFNKSNNNQVHLPVIGNGEQNQYPIFPTKSEALSYAVEPHGILPIVKKVRITLEEI